MSAAFNETGPYRVEVLAYGETTWATNQLRFETVDEARAYMISLANRWLAVDKARVVDEEGNVYATWPDEKTAKASTRDGSSVEDTGNRCVRCGRPLSDTNDVLCSLCLKEVGISSWEGDVEDVRAASRKGSAYEPIAYMYEDDDYHCENCTVERFGRCSEGHVACQGPPDHEPKKDSEGYPVQALPPFDEWALDIDECQVLACGDCGAIIDTVHAERCEHLGSRGRAHLGSTHLVDRVDAFIEDETWFSGHPSDIWRRVASAEALLDEVRQARSKNDTVSLRDAESTLVATIDMLKRTAAVYDQSYDEDFLSGLPGGTVALDYERLIDGGLVDIGPDDGSWLFTEAKKVQQEAANYDWDAFANNGAEDWVAEKARDNPEMLRHEVTTRLAAVDYARDKTMVLLDAAKRAAVIDAFVTNVERYRREAVRELDKIEREKRVERFRAETNRVAQIDRILDEHGLMW